MLRRVSESVCCVQRIGVVGPVPNQTLWPLAEKVRCQGRFYERETSCGEAFGERKPERSASAMGFAAPCSGREPGHEGLRPAPPPRPTVGSAGGRCLVGRVALGQIAPVCSSAQDPEYAVEDVAGGLARNYPGSPLEEETRGSAIPAPPTALRQDSSLLLSPKNDWRTTIPLRAHL
jgi:hypothetical protein